MEDFKERLKNEYIELKDKVDKLSKALSNPNFKDKVGDVQFYLLDIQINHMFEYLKVLRVRIFDLGIKIEEND